MKFLFNHRRVLHVYILHLRWKQKTKLRISCCYGQSAITRVHMQVSGQWTRGIMSIILAHPRSKVLCSTDTDELTSFLGNNSVIQGYMLDKIESVHAPLVLVPGK